MTERALAICRACPHREPCLENALRRNEVDGIWGGRTATERRAIRRERRTQALGRVA